MRRVLGRSRPDRGSAALFVAIFAPAIIFMAGLVIDGGAALEAKQRAADSAEQAARAAAGQCDVALLRSLGDCRITDRGAVNQAAAPYLEEDDFTPAPRIELTREVGAGQYHGVRVTVTVTFRTTLLGIDPNFKNLTVTETAEAVAVTGL
ncbi:MAG TPA: pilus assembly protein TadG-related protein [Mycobacteriales bacterium]